MNQAVNKNTKITAVDVAEYLKMNTAFFQQYPDLLLMMKLDEQPDGAISLVERQMKGLRNRNRESEQELQQVIRNAKDNQHLLQQTINLTLNLISCVDIASLAEILFLKLHQLFDIEHRNLLLDQAIFGDKTDYSVDMHSVRETLGDNFPQQQPVCGRLKNSEKKSLFVDHSKVKSGAILALGEQGELGLLVLGSEDPAHFDPEMGNLFLTLIADMLSRLLYRFSK